MSGRPGIIGICISEINEEDRFNFIKALNRRAVENNYRLMIFNTNTDFYEKESLNDRGEAALFNIIPYDELSVMIVMTHFFSKNMDVVDEIIKGCRRHNKPVITVDGEIEGCIDFSFDYSDIFEKMCDHVIVDHHARRLFMMAGNKESDFSQDRVEAFRRSLEKNGLEFDPDNVGYGDFWQDPTVRTLKRWFEEEKREYPEAIICANDTMAIVVCDYLREHDVKVPKDCIVTGFDGIMQAEYNIPHLTTCVQDYDKMGIKIIEAVRAISENKDYPARNKIGFHLIKSQSCGCEPINVDNINEVITAVLNRYVLARQRQHLMCSLQTSVSKMTSISELTNIITNEFIFYTLVFAINDDIFREPDFGLYHKGEKAFSDFMNVLYHRYFWNPEDPTVIPTAKLIPDLDVMLAREDPIIVCSVHFIDLVLGYCVFQPAIDFDEYEKIVTFMHVLGASLGSYHTGMQIKSINSRLLSVNEELERLYIHDHMTGLLNRRGFYRNFNIQLNECSDSTAYVVFISADLDGLKYINDTFGHLEGDNAITTVGRGLLSTAIQGEICSRFGGDEFTVAGVIPQSIVENYFENFKKRFRDFLAQYNKISGKEYLVESSIGHCIKSISEKIDIDEMIKEADDQMYEDKIARKKNRR